MKSTKIQKFISSFIIFSLLFGITFRVPFLNFSTFAGSSDFFNLVSIIIDEDSYSEISSEINRYANDIQGVLENTKVVILPTPKNTKAFNIASLNESLYYEGYKSVDDSVNFESKLIGTVLVGDFNLPVVYDKNESSQSIVPFTDFENKSYIYNHENNRYEVNDKNSIEIKSEIWHGVISPNLGSFDDNIKGLKDYFDKNHDFYLGSGNFQISEGIINGNNGDSASGDYEPYVFYNDQFREEKSLNYSSFQAYEAYMENLEDIIYNRFSQELADKISGKALGYAEESISSSAEEIALLNEELGTGSLFPLFNSEFVETLITQGPDTSTTSDIQTRKLIENVKKTFMEIFSKGTLGEFRKDVYNAGRYNEGGSDVNVDMIPILISILDVVNGELLKDISDKLEEEIDELVITGLSSDIPVPSNIVLKNNCDNGPGNNTFSGGNNCDSIETYKNFLYGKKVENMDEADECSIYRGSTTNSGKLVEANRGLNISLFEEDKIIVVDQEGCETQMMSKKAYVGWWGGNTPFNIEMNLDIQGMIELENNDLDGSIIPLFDIGGSTKITDSSKTLSPLDCYDDNLILAEKKDEFNGNAIYRLPNVPDNIDNREDWNCTNDNNINSLRYYNPKTFKEVYEKMDNKTAIACEKDYLYLNGQEVNNDVYEEDETVVCQMGYVTSFGANTTLNVVHSNLHQGNAVAINGGTLTANVYDPVEDTTTSYTYTYNSYDSNTGDFTGLNNVEEGGSAITNIGDITSLAEISTTLQTATNAANAAIVAGSYGTGSTAGSTSSLSNAPVCIPVTIYECSGYTPDKRTGTDYHFNDVASHIFHKSPTEEELKIEIEVMTTPSLPADKSRYIDFISPIGNFTKDIKIDYPYLFGIIDSIDGEITIDKVSEKVDELLNAKSVEVNNIINSNNPSSLSGTDLILYNHLKTGSYPGANLDLLNYLKNNENTVLNEILGTENMSHYDTVIFAIFWHSIKSVSKKYAFVFDYYLNDQLEISDQQYVLPKNKKIYEIAYLGGEGDTENMYVKMDPESKADNVYADLISDNMTLSSSLFASNIGPLSGSEEEALFKCAPPEGVPLWEWLPAVMCRLGEMLPPTISFSDSKCSASTLMSSDDGGDDEDESLGSDDDSSLVCEGDLDNNGISDCIENELQSGGIIEMLSDSEKYYYNSNVSLNVKIKDNEGKNVKSVNGTIVFFELQKIEDIEGEVVYDVNDDNFNDKTIISSYINFNNGEIRLNNGEADYYVGTKNKEINIYLKATIKQEDDTGNEIIFMESDELKIEVRGDRLFSSTYKLNNKDGKLEVSNGASSIKVSDKNNIILVDGTDNNIEDISNSINNSSLSNEKIVMFVDNLSISGDSLPISYPLDVSVLEGETVIENFTISKSDLNIFKSLLAIKKSGSYAVEITDNEGFKTKKNIELLPDLPDYVDLELGTTIMQTGGSISTNFLSIYDKYSNLTTGTFYDIDIEIDGDGIEFIDEKSNNYKSSTYEGYKIFRLKSTDYEESNNINVKIIDSKKTELLEASKSIETVKDIDLEIKSLSDEEDVKVGGGAYKYEVSIKDSDGNIMTDFNSRIYLIANPIYLSTNEPYVKLENGVAEVEFNTNTVAGKNIPIEFQIEGLTQIMEGEITIYPEDPLKVDLILSKNKIEASKDEYSILTVELKDRYNNVVFNDSSTNTNIEILDQFSHIITSDKDSSIVDEGIASYKIYATDSPGLAYFKISTDPSLENNFFKIEDENGSVTIKGVGANAGKIETFYFWNKSKIENKKYNSLYTTLLGSNYGDITVQDYLAGSLLFERDNRALAVTSLLGNPYEYSNILKLDKTGSLKIVAGGQDLSQDIQIGTKFINNKLAFDIYNKSLNIYVGDIFYNFDDNTKLIDCESSHSECIDESETSIHLKSYSNNYTSLIEDDRLVLQDIYGENKVTIGEDGTISRAGFIEFEYDESNNTDNLLISIIERGIVIAKIGFNFVDTESNISRDENLFNAKINSVKNTILILIRTNSYGTYDYGDLDNRSNIFYYNDPFDSENTLNTFTKSNLYGYENFVNDYGIGWKDGNKSLLEFAAGKTVGESVQDYMSFGIINLGDPVISLKKIKKQIPSTSIDRKFDATIGKLLSTDTDISEYHIFDYDNDDIDDILLIKNNNYFKLLENKKIESDFIDKGNLAYITDLGALDMVGTGDFSGDGYDDIFFVNNDGEPFLLNNVNKNFTRYSLIEDFDLGGIILVAKVFDMDNDDIDDIVTLDDSGEINIFYGGGTSNNPDFTKLTLSNDNGIKLSSSVRRDNSIVYFDELYQPPEEPSENERLDNLLFIKYPYYLSETTVTHEGILSGEQQIDEEIPSLHFLKTEYSRGSGIKIEKTFIDRNDGFLLSSDMVDTNIVLTNDTDEKINNIVFGEKVPTAFDLNDKSIDGDKIFDIKSGVMGYHFIVDGFDLEIGESITITYESKVKPLKHSYIDVGLFEHEETGDDLYGDIIVKEDNNNCGDTVDLFRSLETIGSRSYEKGTKTPKCDDEKIELPEELAQNTIDEDGNGVPDYIDELSNTGDTTALEQYSQEQLEELNLDTDDVGSVIEALTNSLEDVNNYIEGLSCGFGAEGCIATPLNRAPLAPGNDPVFMGELIGDGLNIDEGLPIFSSITGIYYGPIWGPCVWPPSPLGYDTQDLGAGGRLGTDSFTNVFRMFVTPTLTGAQGMALCFGGSADIMGNLPPDGVSPLTPGGNCIVTVQSMDFCGGDGSDGDPESVGIPIYTGDFGIINGNCGIEDEEILGLDLGVVENYLSSGGVGNYNYSEDMFSESGTDSLFTNEDGLGMEISLNLDAGEDGNFDDILQIEMTRITPFPSWLMDWVTRQIEEIANKLTDFPTIFIILPDFTGIMNMLGDDNNIEPDNDEAISFGIKETYEFIGSIPLVYVEQETVDIVLPWISEPEINKTMASWEATVDQRNDEIVRAKNEWSLGIACDYEDSVEQQACEEENALSQQVSLEFITNFDSLINSLNTNLETLKEYKKIPEKINKLINIKEVYLEQILCNIESISNILGGRIGKNGERFQAWVETYILIKAVLKSWQALIDVFVDYEEECHDCKNERQDGLEEEFSLIGAIMPSIPIVTFPKWPDIILDLHNIRAGLRIALPEFNIDTKPIVLPTLPSLYLPSVPSANLSVDIKLPEIPLLPPLEIPELPELPSLPSIELPDLPPPPNLPEILSEISVVVEIIDLIAQAMCILKSSPFVPEWRAGDQIAFLTERGGYLSSDFIEVSFAQFSFPSVDAIKVSTYVNLEFETAFIVELAKQIVMPLNNFSNDFVNIFDIKSADLDFRNYTPESIDINIEIGSDEVGYNKQEQTQKVFATRVATNILHLVSVIKERKNDLVNGYDFKKLINNSLASKTITENPKLDKVRQIWEGVNNLTYSKEKSIIEELQNNNIDKFIAVNDIINTEIIKNKELKKKFNNIGKDKIIKKVSYINEEKTNLYNNTLDIYNDKFKESAKKLFNSGKERNTELKELKNDLISKIKTPLKRYSENMSKKMNSRLLADSPSTSTASPDEPTDCQKQAESDYKYDYEGIYILEEEKSYRLFDYLDELDGNEAIETVDLDKDGDLDILYFVKGQLFLKENLKTIESVVSVTTNPIILESNNNKFYNSEYFHEAINNAKESGNPNGRINLVFSSPTDKSVNNFRIGFYTIVDKYLNKDNYSYTPENIDKDIIDAISGINEITIIEETDLLIKRKNLVYVSAVGDLRNTKLVTKELTNIGSNLLQNQIVNISAGTTLYAGGNSFSIDYIEKDDENKEEKSLNISANENVELQKSIKIIGLSGDAYVEGQNDITYNGTEITNHLKLPLFPGATITYDGDTSSGSPSYIELTYYDNSEISLDFSETKKWELYDLGNRTPDHFVGMNRDNDYYYAKINSFKDNIDSTLSRQILLAPQIESDKNPPDLSLNNIRVPIYQKYTEDITSYIYEYSGVKNISEVIVDLDLETDSDGNGNKTDDNDTGQLIVEKSLISIKLKFNEFEELFKKKIGITLIDTNNNVGYKEVTLEIYTPTPQITNFSNGLIEGSINESLTDEPIDLYRYRGGSILKLEDVDGLTKTNTDSGDYSFYIGSDDNTGLDLSDNGSIIATINENTGKISLIGSSASIKVLSSSDDNNDKPFPKIIIQKNGEDIFYEYLQIEGTNNVKIVNDFNNITEKGIYFKLIDRTSYNYYTIPETLDYSPGSLSVYRLSDISKSPLFTIFKDGRIDTINYNYKLEYSDNNDYIVLKIMDSHFDREIGSVMFVIEGEYIMK